MTNKIKLGAIVILLSTLTVFAQTKARKLNVSEELKKSAVELLRETPRDVVKLQSATMTLAESVIVADTILCKVCTI